MENKVFYYEILGESWGVVLATDKNDAERKVREAYQKHDTCYNEDTPVIIQTPEESNGKWFNDSPDVFEVWG